MTEIGFPGTIERGGQTGIDGIRPDMDTKDLKQATKQVQAWVKKHADTPLLLVNSIRRDNMSPVGRGDNIPPAGLDCVPTEVPERNLASKLIRKVEPIYPDAAKRAHISGSVVLTVTIDENGNVEEIIVKSGHPLLAAASILAVQQWKYTPSLMNGKQVPIITTVTTVFKLR